MFLKKQHYLLKFIPKVVASTHLFINGDSFF